MKFPIGIQTFHEIRKGGYLYVDKTPHIHRLIHSGKYFFLSRPRRFGKSLLLSTLEDLYAGRKELFEGLWIEKHWDWSQSRKVIHLKFSSQGMRTLGTAEAIDAMLEEEAQRLGVRLERKKGYDVRFRELIEKASDGQKVVLLIDEYDKPIIDFLDELPRAKENREILKNFYSVLKDSDPYLELAFITGVSRFAKTSIFSDLNNLINLSMHPLALELLGISREELEQYLGKKLQALASEQGLSTQELRQQIEAWYNGYSWDGSKRLYNPFSLFNFFLAGEFDNFWFETGTPSFLIKRMQETRFYRIEQMKVSDAVLDSYELENLNPITLLFQTGYLTIKQKYKQGIYIVDYPNKEVKISLEERLLNAYSFDEFETGKVKALELAEAIEKGNLNHFIEIVNATFAHIPAGLWQKENEAFYHALIHLLCSLMGAYIRSEVNSAQGRLDAIIETKDALYILEFKLDKSAEEALRQIEEKGYFKPYLQSGKKRIGVGINFSSAKKAVESWKVKQF
ncbi:MAG: AAA family ATPase [Bacteroidetes bacterium]|nr:MAG: AAA family ATPase [Bacteroidota bacterium]